MPEKEPPPEKPLKATPKDKFLLGVILAVIIVVGIAVLIGIGL